jgi:UDP-glucose 4-epimerase
MKCFVSGGAGFIGSHLVDRLLEHGHHVTVFDNLTSGKREYIESHLEKHHFNFICGDLMDLDLVKSSIKSHDYIFHLAANPDAKLGIECTDLDLNQETIVTYNILEAMRIANIKRIIFSSSGTIYGETPILPLSEDYGPILPISLYGAGKLASEGLISAFCNTFQMQSWIYRFSNIIGERATHGVIFDFINKLINSNTELEILGDGSQEKPYLYVKECIDAILFCIQHSNEKINLFNIGCDTSTSVNKIASLLIKEMGIKNVKLSYTGGDRGWPGDVPQVRFNCKKINDLGWKAKMSSDQAVQKTISLLLNELGA